MVLTKSVLPTKRLSSPEERVHTLKLLMGLNSVGGTAGMDSCAMAEHSAESSTVTQRFIATGDMRGLALNALPLGATIRPRF
jgi:hypothetical protein